MYKVTGPSGFFKPPGRNIAYVSNTLDPIGGVIYHVRYYIESLEI